MASKHSQFDFINFTSSHSLNAVQAYLKYLDDVKMNIFIYQTAYKVWGEAIRTVSVIKVYFDIIISKNNF